MKCHSRYLGHKRFLPKMLGLGFNYCTEQQQQFYCYGSIPLLLLIHERRRNSSCSILLLLLFSVLAFFPKWFIIFHWNVSWCISHSKNWGVKKLLVQLTATFDIAAKRAISSDVFRRFTVKERMIFFCIAGHWLLL